MLRSDIKSIRFKTLKSIVPLQILRIDIAHLDTLEDFWCDEVPEKPLIKHDVPKQKYQEVLHPSKLHHLPEARDVSNLLFLWDFHNHVYCHGRTFIPEWKQWSSVVVFRCFVALVVLHQQLARGNLRELMEKVVVVCLSDWLRAKTFDKSLRLNEV